MVTSDARGSATLNDFVDSLPEQFVEVGIAEQNAVGVGAGLALAGKNVFVCGPACFYSARSLEQIKVDVAYTKTSVKIIGVSGGFSYGALGSTHHSLHDVAGINDHQVPGKGSVDFAALAPYLPENCQRTMEINPRATPEELLDGMRLLTESGCIHQLR